MSRTPTPSEVPISREAARALLPTAFCLTALLVAATSGTGWRRHGVRGWHFSSEVATLMGTSPPELLFRLFRKGLVDRAEVRETGRPKPRYMHRISAAGVAFLASHVGTEMPAVDPPAAEDLDAGCLYAPLPAWKVLEALRQHAAEGGGVRHFGMAGWMRTADVVAACGSGAGEQLPWLLSRGLVQRRATETHGFVYRITATGQRVRLVDAARVGLEPARRVQVRVDEGRRARRGTAAAVAALTQGADAGRPR